MAADRSAAMETTLNEIRAHGGRVTPARRAVLSAILGAGEHHFTAAETLSIVERTTPRPDRATVYRTLELLTEIGLLRPLFLDGDATVYHRTDHDHGHLVCESCGAITEIPTATVSDLTRALQHDTGFAIDVHSVAISGTCARCVQQSAT
jgi:Fur family ferric uptake transcriptional regulator